ncbi:hypothetical protein CGRA01v4_10634 [Colletotrichum graminicola]|nr:hypothetical protein CGRA01v4_10634 [Colletotrichum graminicola]
MHLPTRATPPNHSFSFPEARVLTACAAVPEPGQDLVQTTYVPTWSRPSELDRLLFCLFLSPFGQQALAPLPVGWLSPRSDLIDARRLTWARCVCVCVCVPRSSGRGSRNRSTVVVTVGRGSSRECEGRKAIIISWSQRRNDRANNRETIKGQTVSFFFSTPPFPQTRSSHPSRR